MGLTNRVVTSSAEEAQMPIPSSGRCLTFSEVQLFLPSMP